MSRVHDYIQNCNNPEEIKNYLAGNAMNVDTGAKYFHRFTDEELTEARKELSLAAIAQSDWEETKKAQQKKIADTTAAYKKEVANLTKACKTGGEDRTDNLYHVDDEETRRVYVFNSEGTQVDEYPLRGVQRMVSMGTGKVSNGE